MRALRAFLLLITATCALARESGYPVISILRQETHGGGSQTFDAATDARGRLVFANLEGVLIYDGAWWTRVPLPTESAFETTPLDDETILVSLLDEVGTVAPNANGSLEYRSLVPQLPPDLRRGLAQPATARAPGGALIVSDFAAFFWNGRAIRVLHRFDRELTRRRAFVDDGRMFVATPEGLLEIGGATTFVGKRIDRVIGGLVLVRGEGLFHLDERPIDSDASRWLKNAIVMKARTLDDGRIAVATLRNGLLLMTPDGRIDQIIDAAGGLPDENLYGVAQDREGALWLAFDSSIARVDANTHVSVIDRRNGLPGGIQTVSRHDGVLIAGTSDGVFRLEETPAGLRARKIGGLRYPWSLLSSGSDLLVGTFGGVWIVRGTAAPVQVDGTDDYLVYAMLASTRDPSLIWLGMEEGLGKLRRTGAGYRFEGVVPGSTRIIGSLVERDGVLWAGSETEGAMTIAADGRSTRIAGRNVQVLDVAGRVVLVPKGGVFSMARGAALVPDPFLGHVHAPDPFSTSGVDAAGNIWLGDRPPRLLRRQPDGRYANEAYAVGLLEGDIDTYYADADGVMWLGTERGLYRVAPASFDASLTMAAPLIHRVVAGNDRVIGGGGGGPIRPAELPPRTGRIRVEIAPLSYRIATSYQYRLDPLDAHWTPWTSQAFLDFTNLVPNDYTFRVRTRGLGGRVSEETTWSFTILPPWYATWWASAIWIALAAALVALIVWLRTKTLRGRTRRLQQLVDQQTETLRDTVEQLRLAKEDLVDKNARLEKLSLADPLTGIANRRYFDRAIAEPEGAGPLSLILVDLDHFKDVNDTQGHLAGDECLRRVGEYLETMVRGSGDAVCRWGGEEFAILLRDADESTAVAVAEGIRTGVTQLGVTASLGVATRTDDSDPRLLVQRADGALYSAKKAGRNRVWAAA